jgi:hypothetical protein
VREKGRIASSWPEEGYGTRPPVRTCPTAPRQGGSPRAVTRGDLSRDPRSDGRAAGLRRPLSPTADMPSPGPWAAKRGLAVLAREVRCIPTGGSQLASDAHRRPSLISTATGPALLKRTSKFTSRPNESSDMTSGSTDELWAKMLFG